MAKIPGSPGGATALINRGNLLLDGRDYARAETAYRSAMTAGDAEYGPLAAIYLGDFLDGPINDAAGAIAAYQQAASSGHPEWGPAAAFLQAGLLELTDPPRL